MQYVVTEHCRGCLTSLYGPYKTQELAWSKRNEMFLDSAFAATFYTYDVRPVYETEGTK